MPKPKVKSGKHAKSVDEKPASNNKDKAHNDMQITMLHSLVENASLVRSSELLQKVFDPRRDLNEECGYPDEISDKQYTTMYEREGVAARVVDVYPESSWLNDPTVEETADAEETKFEEEWKNLVKQFNIYSMLERADKISGVMRFGVVLLGIDDGLELKEPVVKKDAKLLFLRTFMESVVTIKTFENDHKNERFGQPVMYSIQFTDASSKDETTTMQTKDVHWTRVIHLADNREMSEIYGVPRIQKTYNRMHDIRKILSSSGEMFYKGAFPGYAFETSPETTSADIDETETAESIRAQFLAYQNGLQRYLAVTGMTVKSLEPQPGDPTAHFEAQLKAVAISIGIPLRVLAGSEQAQLASEQDTKAWNGRVAHRQDKYVSPMVLRPFIDRLMEFGVISTVDSYEIIWPDLHTPSAADKAEVMDKITSALMKYVKGDVNTLMGPADFLKIIMGLDDEQIEAIKENVFSDINDEQETQVNDESTE